MSDIAHVVKRSGAVVPFKPERIANAIYRAAVAVGGRDRERSQQLAAEVVRLLQQTTPAGHTPHIEEIQDLVEKVLIENGHASVAKAYILYRDERRRLREQAAKRASQPSENIPWAKIWHVLNWAVSHNLHTVEDFNQRVRRGEFPHIVHESEAAYEDDVDNALRLITERRKQIRAIIVSGPSASGKTTTTVKLERRLKQDGLRPVTLNVDNYFFDLEIHPQDEFGDYDFETPQALDLDLINEHLRRLIDGETVRTPHYDFKTGKQHLEQTPLQLGEDEVLLIDSLHGLYPAMTEGISPHILFKLYLEPLLQMRGPDNRYIRWTDLRLMRRMLRDAIYRAWNPEETLVHWHYVRSSELRNIIPYHRSADVIINSAMPYELALYVPRLLDHLARWQAKYRENPLREDAYRRARRVHELLQAVEPVEDDSPVPRGSVLREFIGDSSLSH